MENTDFGYWSEEWTEGYTIIDMLGGTEYLKLILDVEDIELTKYFRSDLVTYATIIFWLEDEGDYERKLVVKFSDRCDLEVKLVESREIGPVLLRRTDLHVKREFRVFPDSVYIFLPTPMRSESLPCLIGCIEEVTGRSLDPFGMLS
jgi:hypothetical protein